MLAKSQRDLAEGHTACLSTNRKRVEVQFTKPVLSDAGVFRSYYRE